MLLPHPCKQAQVLYNLYLETGKERYRDCAHRFDKPAFYQALVEGRDALAGLHANTHLAQVNHGTAQHGATRHGTAWHGAMTPWRSAAAGLFCVQPLPASPCGTVPPPSNRLLNLDATLSPLPLPLPLFRRALLTNGHAF